MDLPVQKMNYAQMKQLCVQLRHFMLKHVSKTGGHLASNLGAVEIIVSLHKVFNTATDRIVFDVGHQAYAHKLLTGRHDRFASLRQWGSLSGFPHPEESDHDAFIAGHASTSASAALGMARARTLTGQNYHCVAVMGDGALTGGLCYEAFNDIGQSKEPIIIILNDNGMSISKNVGGISKHLAILRTRPQYFRLKREYHRVTDPLPGGKQFNRFIHTVKTGIRDAVLPGGTFFESMGFLYYGPVSGHDIPTVVNLLEQAKLVKKPVLIHLLTKKGKGYAPSERNPCAFHGVAAFNVKNGHCPTNTPETYAHRFGRTLTKLADSDKRIVAVTAAMREGVGLDCFYNAHPTRFFDVGIAEGHAVTLSAAMAKQGLRPFVAIYSSFLQRAYDMILHDTALLSLPVVFAVDRAGLVGEDGVTHHGLYDVGFLSQIPNLTLLAPSSLDELDSMLSSVLKDINGPVAIRYPRGGNSGYTENHASGPFHQLSKGKTGTIVTYGAMTGIALEAARMLSSGGLSVGVVKLNRLSPLPFEELLPVLTKRFAVLEEAAGHGSAGQRLAAHIALSGSRHKPLLLNLEDHTVPHGSVQDQRKHYGIDADGVCSALKSAWTKNG
jgi:1-deoxy-D-xylulose-5-phosphate synthase